MTILSEITKTIKKQTVKENPDIVATGFVNKFLGLRNKKMVVNLSTTTKSTWCPGCWNFQILAGVKNYLNKKIKTEEDKKNYAIVAGIGCHAKIFDYLKVCHDFCCRDFYFSVRADRIYIFISS